MTDNSVAVTSGSVVVTGTTTAFVGYPGDLFNLVGLSVPIASIDSATQITLAQPWPGSTLTGQTGWSITPTAPSRSSVVTANTQMAALILKFQAGGPLAVNGAGTIADRALVDSKPTGFTYLSTDETPNVLYAKQSDTSGDWSSGQPIGDASTEAAAAAASATAAAASAAAISLPLQDAQVATPATPADAIDSAKLRFLQSGTGATTRYLQDKVRELGVSVGDFLSVAQIADVLARTYTLDVSGAVQKAIGALGAAGGTVRVPAGGYRIESTVQIGNGSTFVASTVNGIKLIGEGAGWGITSEVGTAALPVQFKLFGTAHSGSVFQINGPINGMGIENIVMTFDTTAGSDASGIIDNGANFSSFRNIGVIGPTKYGIVEGTPGNGSIAGGQHNTWENVYLWLGTTPGVQGILYAPQTGDDRAFDSWRQINIVMSDTSQIGIQFQNCDSIKMYDLQFNPCGATAIQYNYTVSPQFPNGIVIVVVDIFDNFVVSTGDAPVDNPNFMNTIYAFSQDNGAALPNLPNLAIINGAQGTWTPTLEGNTTAGSPTYTAQVGSFERNGRTVTARFSITVTALGGMAGNVIIGGLPFTSTSDAGDFGYGVIAAYNGVTMDTGYTQLGGKIGAGKTVMAIYENGSGVVPQGLPVSGLAAGVIFEGYCVYR